MVDTKNAIIHVKNFSIHLVVDLFLFSESRYFSHLRAKFLSGIKVKVGKNTLIGKNIIFGNNVQIGNEVFIESNCEIFGPVRIGNNVYINRQCYLNGKTEIGNNVQIGPRVSLIAVTHKLGDFNSRAGDPTDGEIIIGDGVWIGACSVILPNVQIGDGAVVAAGAVVNKNVSPNTIVGGCPAKIIKEL